MHPLPLPQSCYVFSINQRARLKFVCDWIRSHSELSNLGKTGLIRVISKVLQCMILVGLVLFNYDKV